MSQSFPRYFLNQRARSFAADKSAAILGERTRTNRFEPYARTGTYRRFATYFASKE
jgi:hypothetical protein